MKDYYKALSVIESCKTIEQLITAAKYLALWYEKYLDYHIYLTTYKRFVEEKFKELGGLDVSILPFKANKNGF
jgi:hypothetical protein